MTTHIDRWQPTHPITTEWQIIVVHDDGREGLRAVTWINGQPSLYGPVYDTDGTVLESESAEAIYECECGRITGEQCAWSGPIGQTVVIEWMPPFLRASHEVARNHGVYPHNGAERLRVERSCADLMIDGDEDWTSIV